MSKKNWAKPKFSGLLVFALVLSLLLVAGTAKAGGKNPLTEVWAAITQLQTQVGQLFGITDGLTMKDADLEARVAALEALHPTPPPFVTLWNNFTPTSDLTEGRVIDVHSYSSAEFHFSWVGIPGHDCQYAYTYYDIWHNETYYSTFWGTGCTQTATIPIPAGVYYVRFDTWTPANGTLNGTLTLT